MTNQEADRLYAEFGRWCAAEFAHPWGGDLDGYAIEQKLLELGLLVSEPFDLDRHRALTEWWDAFAAGDPFCRFIEGAEPQL